MINGKYSYLNNVYVYVYCGHCTGGVYVSPLSQNNGRWAMTHSTRVCYQLESNNPYKISKRHHRPHRSHHPNTNRSPVSTFKWLTHKNQPNKTNNIKILLWLLLFKCLASSPSRFKSNVVVDRIRMSQLWLLLFGGARHHWHPSLLESVEH